MATLYPPFVFTGSMVVHSMTLCDRLLSADGCATVSFGEPFHFKHLFKLDGMWEICAHFVLSPRL